MRISHVVIAACVLLAPVASAQTYNARTDVTAQAYPGSIPCPSSLGCGAGGNISGANYTFTPSDFNLPVTRVTDFNTPNTGQHNYVTDCGGSAESNPMDTSNTRFYVCTTGAASLIFSFNATTRASTFLYQASSGCGGGGIRTSPFFSYTQSQVAYQTCFTAGGNPAVEQLDVSSNSTEPTVGNGKVTTVFDMSSCVGALAGVGTTVYTDDVTVSKDDQTFGNLGSTTVGQGSSGAIYVIVWNRTLGCRVWNTNTNLISGSYGGSPTGAVTVNGNGTTAPYTGAFTLHNVRIGTGGTWVKVACQGCQAANYFWNVNTLQVYEEDNDATCGGGHTSIGYNTTVNNCNGFGHPVNFFTRPNNSLGTHTALPSIYPSPSSAGPAWSGHLSWWNNGSASDTGVSLLSETNGVFAPDAAWDNEILGIGSGVVYRFAHTYATQLSPFFAAANAIGEVSADGRYFFWTTDWDGMLGNVSGVSNACTIAVDCRVDVFVTTLPLAGTTFTSGVKVTSGTSLK